MIQIPEIVIEHLKNGARLAINLSGGKDSQAMARALWEALPEYRHHMFCIHADLGRMEWTQTIDMVKQLAKMLKLPLTIVSRPKGDLLARWQERMELLKGQNKPHWSSSAARYCTSDLKRNPINTYLRNYPYIISCEGIRAIESYNRAKKEVFSTRTAITTKNRKAFTWYPIFDWSEEQVWESWGMSSTTLSVLRLTYAATGKVHSMWPFHPAYVFGNQRLSCCMCVLGSKKDLANGVKHNPEIAKELAKMEDVSGFTFRKDISITQLIKEQTNAH